MGSILPGSKISSIKELSLSGKQVFMRLDFNVPIQDGKITDDSRITEALPTIQYALQKGAKLILASHLGRPDGQRKEEFSLEPVAKHLASLLKQDVTLADDCIGEGIEMMAKSLKNGQILLLENLRFYAGEEANDPGFARQLSRLCEVYVTDAFGTAHRKHASTYGLPSIMTHRGMGLLIEKELKFMDHLLESAERPFLTILGGSKVTDKIKTIESLLKRVDGLIIGGAMAHAFWAVEQKPIPEGAKQPKPADIAAAKAVLAQAKTKGIPVYLPSDTNQGFDIGPESILEFNKQVQKAKTVFWNGPLGWFEKPEYAMGTFELAKSISQLKATKIVGGGDTVSAIKASGFSEGFDHLSTGGGAVLEYLEGVGLPGIDVLKGYIRESADLIFHDDDKS